ncbi:MAG: pyridoxal phosphate-dependent aminotransferase [Firmicutes bacterium]|nr:pyridoxal phosphate-dependent aminotransferase [Bacillota bacterium]
MERITNRATAVAPSLTLAITAKGNKMKAEGLDVVSFAAGEPDFNTPAYVIEKAKEALDKGVTKYTPSAGTLDLRKAIAAKLLKDNGLSYEPNQIVVSNGAKHSLYNACLALVNPGDEVLIPAPYWLTYPELVLLCGGVPMYMETSAAHDFKITPDELKKAITAKTKAVILNNPSNPTGTVYTEAELKALAAVIEKAGIYVIADEIYEELVYDGLKMYSIAAYSESLKKNTILVNGLSKAYAMTGWRVGYTASCKDLAEAMDNMQSHTTSNANSIAQYASVAALSDPAGVAFIKELKATFTRRRDLAVKLLSDAAPLSFVRPQGAFYVMVGMENLVGKSYAGKTIKSAADFSELLVDHAHVVTIPCESFGAPMYIRLSYAIADSQIEKGIGRIVEFAKRLV